MARRQISFGRVLVSVTMFALALGRIAFVTRHQSELALALKFTAFLGFAAMGNVFKRPWNFALVGFVGLFAPLWFTLPRFNKADKITPSDHRPGRTAAKVVGTFLDERPATSNFRQSKSTVIFSASAWRS